MNAERRVAHLRLRSSDEALNRRGAILIEDALRTASLPDGGSRVLVIRKLSLGRIRASSAPSSISLRIEEAFARVAASAVHALSGEAAMATAVYFEHELEALTILAVRAALGLALDEWFWPLAVKGWKPGMTRDETMRTALAGALSSTAATAAALAFMRAMLRHGVCGTLAGALRYQDGGALLRAFGWSLQASVAAYDSQGVPESLFEQRRPEPAGSPSSEIARVAAPWFAAWGATDPRTFWLASALCAVESPFLATQPAMLAARASRWIVAETRPFSRDVAVEASSGHAMPGSLSGPSSKDDAAGARESIEVNAAAPRAYESPQQPVPTSARPGANQLTSRAGLFFLIPAMERLAMPAWLESHAGDAEWLLPYRVLQALALRLETPPGDPVLHALGDLASSPPRHVEEAVIEWVRRLRRYCRRSRIGLHSLVCRPGRIAFTDTHIDVLFRLRLADIRVRRAGFDVDPGWTPWFGRVVRFHYLNDEAYDG